jgi:hypothetical protein
MLQKFILNDMAKELTKHERDTLNNIINTMVSSAYKFLTIQATDKYPFNIFIDDDLGKRYLEKAMAVVSLHYEDWEV